MPYISIFQRQAPSQPTNCRVIPRPSIVLVMGPYLPDGRVVTTVLSFLFSGFARCIVALFSVLDARHLQDSANDGLVNLGDHGLRRRILHSDILEQDDILCARNVW